MYTFNENNNLQKQQICVIMSNLDCIYFVGCNDLEHLLLTVSGRVIVR